MSDATAENPTSAGRLPFLPILMVAGAVLACTVYANLAFAVDRPSQYRFFPPFERGLNANMNWELGHEYFNIARSLAAGDGFANPFPGKTGPTAWMPPILPMFLAALWWLCAGNRESVLVIVLIVQAAVLIATGVLIVMIAQQTARRVGPGTGAACFVVALLCNFRDCFQANGDRWITLLAIDLLIAGFFWFHPLRSWQRALCWGVFGGLCALTAPVAGFAWGLLSVAIGVREHAWTRIGLMLLMAVLAVAPWMWRNYQVFGRWIPVKSNLAYEMYQSHCLQSDGMLQGRTLGLHPYQRNSKERREYDARGEMAYLDLKANQFQQAVAADPVDFLDRIAARFFGATLWYVPMDRAHAAPTGWLVWTFRIMHPLPFLGLVLLLLVGIYDRLPALQWTIIALYLLYLAPYVIASYYARYAFPLLAAKVLLTCWAIDHLLRLRCRRHS